MSIEETIARRTTEEVARIFKKDVAEITRETRFVEDLHAKSINVVQLVAVLENEFGVSIPFMETRRRKTVGDAIDFVIALRKG